MMQAKPLRGIYVDRSAEIREVMEARNLPAPPAIVFREGNPSDADLMRYGQDTDVLIVEHTHINAGVIDACPSLHALLFMGTGVESYVDVARARQRGLRIVITPGYADQSVAEHCLALMFAGARHIARMDRDLRAGKWAGVEGIQLKGRKVAVVGLGGIGTVFADLATALGMRVAGWNRTPMTSPYFESDLDAALSGADVLSLHLGLNKETEGIIDERRLGLAKRGCILINTARAALVDEGALLRALANGQIGHAALDVFPTEPLTNGNPYTRLENVTLSPHTAWMTKDACAELWLRTLKAFVALQQGG
ncbi:MAG TPA: NAD(P)-dependent oxidoreductase [Steroidobacteraceae bacterium]|jgi:D-3-phosphoglycerate dehydrogenase